MIIERLYTEALAQSSYLAAAEGGSQAIVVDPNRDVETYLHAAAERKLRITHVTETHIHADFVSGARELARRAGAALLLSGEGDGEWQYRLSAAESAELLRDGDSFDVGSLRFDVRHMPGHTPEHLVFLVTETTVADRPAAILTGDFIFVGDVGRPDLLERAAGQTGTMERSARTLFQSLRRMREYPDYLQLWPGHGAGSACGKSLGSMPSTTLGYERLFNWAFQFDDEEEFVRAVLAGQPEPPRYFARMKQINRDGAGMPRGLPSPMRRFDARALAVALAGTDGDVIVIDARPTAEYAQGFIPGTINLPAGTSFLMWAGSLLPYDRDLVLLIGDGGEGKATELRRQLFLIGLDRVTGWAGADVLESWQGATSQPLERIESIGAAALAERDDVQVVDVRAASEWSAGHIPGAIHAFLGNLPDVMSSLPRGQPIVVSCQGGSRSSIAASILRANGFTDVINFVGGFGEWQRAGLPVETNGTAAPVH